MSTITTSGTLSQVVGSTTITFTDSVGPTTLTLPVSINAGLTVTMSSDLSYNASLNFTVNGTGVTFDGSGNKVYISASYGGLIRVANASYITNIKNVGVSSTASLSTSAGWILGAGSNTANINGGVTITNCYSTGFINTGGGIAGNGFAGNLISCYSSGNITGAASGGMCGRYSTCTATNCYYAGAAITTGGGIFGTDASGTAINCYTTNSPTVSNGGGIFAGFGGGATVAASTPKPVAIAINCYSNCIISGTGGGIIGPVNFGTTSTPTYPDPVSTATNCYSTGANSGTGGGIFGAVVNFSARPISTATNCYSTGAISGAGSGGIFGSIAAGVFTTTSTTSSVLTAINCYSTGAIATGGGGIFGKAFFYNQTYSDAYTITATNCYSTGNITGGGGIFAPRDSSYSSIVSSTANYCYSIGTITAATSDSAGGIFGRYNNATANYCYSNGAITGSGSSINVGGIFGDNSISTANYCYSSGVVTGSVSGGIFSDTSGGNANNCYSINAIRTNGATIINCIASSAGTWVDTSANSTIGVNVPANWGYTTYSSPWLLSSFNSSIYDPSFETFTESIDSYTANGIYGSTTVYGGSSISPTYQIMSSTTPTKNIPTFSTATGGLTFTHPEGTYTYNILCYYTYNSAKVGYNFSAYTLTAPIPCFLLGTKIKVSPTEYKLIQDLKEGDFVYTSDERVVPILKINHYNVLPNPLSSPYIIPEGYRYGEFVCDQDLYLSPEHAVLIDSDKLVPVKALGFQQDTTLTDLTYFHITLPNLFTDHLVANGIPCESYAGESALQSSGNYISMYFNHEIFKKVYDKQHFIRKNLTFEKYNRIVESTTINLPIPLKALPTYEIIPSGVDFNFAELI